MHNNYEQTIIISKFPYGGGTSLEFPIYLVEGDNGQVGVDLCNYIHNKATTSEYGSRNYYFSENEIVFFSAFGITEKITHMYRPYYLDEKVYIATLSQFGGSTVMLRDTGNITANWV